MKRAFDDDARRIVGRAQQQARALGHRGIGCEHLLFAVAESADPAGAVLREHGLTPAHVSEQTRRLLSGTATVFDTLDGDALATLGIDLQTVRRTVEATFGPEALRPVRPSPRRRWYRRRPRRPGGHLPVTGRAQRCLDAAAHEAKRAGSTAVDATTLAVAVVTADGGLVPRIVRSTGVPAEALRTAILRRARHAG
ncbi:Clp protease N-terminal domain-containing protein [Amycolatopsis vastitatis]|uniref:Clp protease N-terminal domain-containing protein n=1 Tax=Amycolatopsis vastitatis TaxID=1905142 RepID=UPI0011787425|nr:Clp protease N-terminal domain-containing protein [Amycolatopsis vastitatis]